MTGLAPYDDRPTIAELIHPIINRWRLIGITAIVGLTVGAGTIYLQPRSQPISETTGVVLVTQSYSDPELAGDFLVERGFEVVRHSSGLLRVTTDGDAIPRLVTATQNTERMMAERANSPHDLDVVTFPIRGPASKK